MASVRTTTSVLNKIDKLEELFSKKNSWVQRAYAETADGTELDDEQVKQKGAAKWCLVGGAIKVGDGLQLYWELALSCELNLQTMAKSYYSPQELQDVLDSRIVGFNDANQREHKEILKAIRETRKRIKKVGLTPLPKIEVAS